MIQTAVALLRFVAALLSVLLIPNSLFTEAHPDCEKHKIVHNLHQICSSYPTSLHKRNTRDFNLNQGFVIQNDLDSWNYVGEQPSAFPSSSNVFQENKDTFSRDPSSIPAYSWNPGPWQPVVWYPAVTVPYPPHNPGSSFDGSITVEDLFDPLNYGGAEVQLPIERWRRVDKELIQQIDGFIRHQCCYRGCAFPSAYMELAQRTNLCNHRS